MGFGDCLSILTQLGQSEISVSKPDAPKSTEKAVVTVKADAGTTPAVAADATTGKTVTDGQVKDDKTALLRKRRRAKTLK